MKGGIQPIHDNNPLLLLLDLGFTEDEIEMVSHINIDELINVYLEILQNRHPGITLQQVNNELNTEEKSEIVDETLNRFYDEITNMRGGKKKRRNKSNKKIKKRKVSKTIRKKIKNKRK